MDTGRTGDLSRQFGDLLGAAGLRPKVPHRKKEGADGKHARHSISFHALRRTATTMLHEAGIPAAVVQSLIGHDSPDVHQVYVSIGREALVKAANALPSIV
jgi:integrase